MKGVLGHRRYMPVRVDAAFHRQQRFELKALVLGQVRAGVGKLEVYCRKAHDACACYVRDNHPRRLERKNPGLRAMRVGGKIGRASCRERVFSSV